MRQRPFVRVIGLVLMALLAVVLYADLQSVHQIFRITEAMINSAPDTQTRQNLIADRDKRDREERRHKVAIEAALGIDVVLFLWLASGILRRHDSVSQPMEG
jgi:low temperature requirement protein LtrA